jgi:hypothetical protein
MNRRFAFETELYATLTCLPLAARKKLDMIGIKISIKQWLALEMGERRAICEMSADSDEERQAMTEFVCRLIAQRCGEQPALLSQEQQASAIPPSQLPAGIAEQAGTLGYELDAGRWTTLDGDQRYALVKFAGDDRRRAKFAAALKEFFG